MKGSIRLLVGFLITFGAVGTLDVNPNASLLVQTALAAVGLAIAYSGTKAIQHANRS
jgi:hypothetical protein